jgi:hypothetical protein
MIDLSLCGTQRTEMSVREEIHKRAHYLPLLVDAFQKHPYLWTIFNKTSDQMRFQLNRISTQCEPRIFQKINDQNNPDNANPFENRNLQN